MIRKLRVYLAGSSADRERIATYALALESSGLVELTSKWWLTADQWSGRDHEKTRGEQQKAALREMDAQAESDMFWLLFPPPGVVSSALAELGIAIAYDDAYIVVSGPGSNSRIYTALADYRDESDELALLEVLRVARAHVFMQGGRERLAVP